jgi:type 1 glutamine amidotransferase
MKLMTKSLTGCLGTTAVLIALTFSPPATGFAFAGGPWEPKHLLVVTVTKEFRHGSIAIGEKVVAELAVKNPMLFTVDFVRNDAEMAAKMTPEALKNYDGVFFLNTTGVLPLPDKQAFLDWIKSGKGFIGTHSATDTLHGGQGVDPYIEMIGAQFVGHTVAPVVCNVEDTEHPATKHLGKTYAVTDEIYFMKNFSRDKVHMLMSLDKQPGSGQPGYFPIAWTRQYGQGRVFYTALGHEDAVWASEPFQKHLLGGIEWALGIPSPYVLDAQERAEGFRPLFNGVNLNGWQLRHPNGHQSWSAQDGLLVNDVKGHGDGTDLVTTEKFRDFTVRYEYKIPKDSNSGFYLRGRHEIQILDDYDVGKPTPGGNGAIYNIYPVAKFVSRKPGEWQTVEATIKGNRVTVILNGVKVHDNVVVDKPTGGELDGNVNEPGPILLQADHGAVTFQNMRIKTL